MTELEEEYNVDSKLPYVFFINGEKFQSDSSVINKDEVLKFAEIDKPEEYKVYVKAEDKHEEDKEVDTDFDMSQSPPHFYTSKIGTIGG